MNRETEELREEIFGFVANPDCEDCDYHEATPLGHCFQNLKTNADNRCKVVDQIVRLCKDDGLRWYDGKNDKFVEIEL